MEKKWADLTWKEKREERFKRWLSPAGVEFVSPEAKKKYKEKVTRLIKAINLEEPDRVPILQAVDYFPAYYAGVDFKTVMYDYEEIKRAWTKFYHDFDFDTFMPPGLTFPGRIADTIGLKNNSWPGHGLPDDAESFQYIEDEYMNSDEYDLFMDDPSDYLLRYFLPRTVKAFEPFQKMRALFSGLFGTPFWYIAQFGDPEIHSAWQTLLDVSLEARKWMQVTSEMSQLGLSLGFPLELGGFSEVPFDVIADHLRGTPGAMTDMFERPDKLHEAMEKMIPVIVRAGVAGADASGCPIIVTGLHKGNSTFMSNKQFETFYWPSFQKTMLGMINEGLVPMPFVEGNYTPRLDIIKDMPKSSVVWFFEQMDMAKAKEIIGHDNCIAGNLPSSILLHGTPQEIKEHCRWLIETCAEGGGYIFAASIHVNNCALENLHSMIDAVKEYGVYKKRI